MGRLGMYHVLKYMELNMGKKSSNQSKCSENRSEFQKH